MADNVAANPSGGGAVFASDFNGSDGTFGAHWPISKVAFGERDSVYKIVSATDPMPVISRATGGVVTDHSANAPTVGSLGTLLTTIAVNAARRSAYVQNQSANVIFIVIDDGASSTPMIIVLDPGAGANRQGGAHGFSDFLHTGRIRVYGTAGAQIAAGEI